MVKVGIDLKLPKGNMFLGTIVVEVDGYYDFSFLMSNRKVNNFVQEQQRSFETEICPLFLIRKFGVEDPDIVYYVGFSETYDSDGKRYIFKYDTYELLDRVERLKVEAKSSGIELNNVNIGIDVEPYSDELLNMYLGM